MNTTTTLSGGQIQQLADLYKKRTQDAKESMDFVYEQWKAGRMETGEYQAKLKVWEDRHYEAIRALELLEQGYLVGL